MNSTLSRSTTSTPARTARSTAAAVEFPTAASTRLIVGRASEATTSNISRVAAVSRPIRLWTSAVSVVGIGSGSFAAGITDAAANARAISTAYNGLPPDT